LRDIPLSSRIKEGAYYFFNHTDDIISTENLSQTKTFDIKRAKYRSGYLKAPTFTKLSDKLISC
jgi:hypothetical protein